MKPSTKNNLLPGFAVNIFTKGNLAPGFAFVIVLLVVAIIQGSIVGHIDMSSISLDNLVEEAVEAWTNRTSIENIDGYNKIFKEKKDLQFSRKYAKEIEAAVAKKLPRVGYKIGGHTPEILDMLNASGPAWGVFYGEDSFLKSYEKVPIVDTEVLGFEPDFMLRVSDERIMEADTVEEVAKYIDRVYAFIEFPTMFRHPDESMLDLHTMQAFNLGARYGVIGEYLDTASDPNIIENLRNMTVVTSDHTGRTKITYHMNTESIHMYESFLYAIDLMKERGESLKRGDLISLGALITLDKFGWIPTQDSEVRHVHYYIGEKVLHVAARFK